MKTHRHPYAEQISTALARAMVPQERPTTSGTALPQPSTLNPQPFSHDLTAVIRAQQESYRAHCSRMRRLHNLKRVAAWVATCVFAVTVGAALGILAVNSGSYLAIITITAFGCYGLNFLLTRH